LVDDCANGPQFFVEADVTDLGSATDLDITDNQGNAAQTVSSTGVVSFGPYPNGTEVVLTAANNQDPNCQIVSSSFTQEFCTTNIVDCEAGPLGFNYCYENNENTTLTYQSSDGSSLNIDILGGFLESCCDDFIVQDTDGTELFNSGGDISGNSFQSTGDSLTVIIESDGSINCQGSGYDPIDFNVSCATCTNPQIAFELVDDCLNAPQFFVEADVASLGSATDLDISDNQGNAAQTVSAPGVVSFGPYANGTEVVLTAANNQDANCQVTSPSFTQEICTTTLVDCEAGPVNTNFCYDSGEDLEFTYVSNDGTPLNLVVNSGDVEEGFDEFIVLDTNGTELFNGFGNDGDLSGLSFQSTGDTITVLVTPDGIIDCQGSEGIDPIDLTVSCATCINPQVEYFVLGECTDADNEGFFVDVEIQDLGDAPSLDVSNNQGDPTENITAPTTVTFGPYPLGTEVVFTVENVDDVNCTLTSPNLTLETCGCFGSDPFCAPEEGEALIFPNVDDSSGTEADPNLSNYGCLVTQPNPVWYFMQIEDSGELVFEIVQNTQFDDNGNPVGEPLDVDFIAWGPFDDTEFCNDLGSCTECDDNTFDDNYPYGNVVDCSWSPGTTETFTIPNAQEGEIYAVLITNFDGAPGFISLGQVNSEDDGSGTTNCDIVLKNQVVACEGEDIILTATDLTADQYQWLLLNEDTEEFEPIEGENQDTLTVTEPGTYQIFTLNGAEVSTEEFDVNLIPEAEVNLPEEVILCENQTDTLDATVLNADQFESFEYQWFQNGDELTGEVQATLNISETGIYTVEITTLTENIDVDGNDLTCVNTYEVNVNGPIFSVSLGEDQNLCDSEVQTISAIIEGEDQSNADFLWSTGETTPSIDVSDSGVYEVTVTIDDCPVTESVTYTFAEEPQFDLGEDLNLCEDEVTTLDATVANASAFTSVAYVWSDDNGIIDEETASTLEVTTEGNYSVEVTTTTTTVDGVEFDCLASDSIFVNITAFTLDLGGDQTLCDAEPQTITASIEGEDQSNATYLWSTGETTQSINVSDSGVYEVTVTIDTCPVTASVEYIFNVSPIIALGPDSETCDLTEFTLDATPSNFVEGNVNYSWTLDGTDLGQNAATINPDDFGFGTYEVNVFFDNPTCNTVDQITLSLRDDISVNITSDDIDNLFCVNETVTFNASLLNAELIEADFQWFVNDQSVGNNTPTLENYEITSTESNQDVRVEVTIGSACFVSNELAFNLYDVDNCVISQGLSPNGDNFNENLDLRFLDDRSGITSIEIFNRYGQRVYEKTDYRDEFFGQSDNGNMLETGTYFYVIKFENEDEVYGQVHKGWIYINREQ
jgi:gliding motility-associated-like protein